MFGNASSTQDHMDYNENTTIKQPEQMACITNVSIPKVESCYSSVSNFNEDTSNTVSIYDFIAFVVVFFKNYFRIFFTAIKLNSIRYVVFKFIIFIYLFFVISFKHMFIWKYNNISKY